MARKLAASKRHPSAKKVRRRKKPGPSVVIKAITPGKVADKWASITDLTDDEWDALTRLRMRLKKKPRAGITQEHPSRSPFARGDERRTRDVGVTNAEWKALKRSE